MRKKWKNIRELCTALDEDDNFPEGCGGNLKFVCYAPNIRYGTWIFKYKGTLVALFGSGNGYYHFHTVVTYLDVIEAKIMGLIERIKYRRGAE